MQPAIDFNERKKRNHKYTLIEDNTVLSNHLKDQCELLVADICFEQKISLPTLYPPLFVPSKLRLACKQLSQYGCTNGEAFLLTALKDKISSGKPNSILLHKNIGK